MTIRVGRIASGVMTMEDDRLAVQVPMTHVGPLKTLSGVLAGLSMTKTTGMGAKISEGQAWIAGTSADSQGGYPVTVDADATFSFAVGDATRDRIDRIVLQVQDNPYDTSGQQRGIIAVVQGAYPTSGGPVAPAIPANSVSLFLQRINHGTNAGSGGIDTSLTTDDRVQAVAAGAKIPVRNQAERDALLLTPGLQVYRQDLSATESWNGTAWVNDLPVYSRRVQTAGKSIANNLFTVVDGWTDVDHSATGFVYSGGIWTVTQPGWYEVHGQIAFGPVASAAGQRAVRLFQNATVIDEYADGDPSAVYNTPLPFKAGLLLASGDTISVQALQTQGVNQSTATGAGLCHLSIHRAGRA